MATTLLGKLRGIDTFGRPIRTNFKGSESHKSLLGGLLTLTVYVLTMINIGIASDEFVNMNDPKLTTYVQPHTFEERADLIPLKPDDWSAYFAIYTIVTDIVTGKVSYEIPS